MNERKTYKDYEKKIICDHNIATLIFTGYDFIN